MIRPEVRDDLGAARRATTRRRSTSTCGSTPTSRPSRRPAACARRARRRARPTSTGTATPIAPPSSCGSAIASCTTSSPRAGLRRQRLERGAPDPAASPTAVPVALSLTFEPTYALHTPHRPHHRHRVAVGERTDDFDARPGDEVRRDRPGAHRRSRSSARRTTRPGIVETEATVRAIASWAPGLVVVDEAYGQFAPWSALDADGRGRAARRHPHVLEDLVDGRRPARLPHRTVAGSSPSSTRSCCRTTSTRSKQIAGRHRARLRRRDGGAGRAGWSRSAARLSRRLSRARRVDVWPSGANFVLFRPVGPERDGRPSRVAGAARPLGARARLLVVASARRLPARHDRHPGRERPIPRPHSRRS